MRITTKPMLAMLGLALTLVAVTASQAQNRDQSLRGKLELAIEVASQGQLKILSLKPTPLSTIFEVELNTGRFSTVIFPVTISSQATCIGPATRVS